MNADQQKWAVLDCGKFPSDINCKIKMMAPVDHIDEVLDLAVTHAVDKHGHQNTQELREKLRSVITYESQ